MVIANTSTHSAHTHRVSMEVNSQMETIDLKVSIDIPRLTALLLYICRLELSGTCTAKIQKSYICFRLHVITHADFVQHVSLCAGFAGAFVGRVHDSHLIT